MHIKRISHSCNLIKKKKKKKEKKMIDILISFRNIISRKKFLCTAWTHIIHVSPTYVSMYPLCITNNIYNNVENRSILNSYFLFSQFLEAIFHPLFTLSIGIIFIILKNNFSISSPSKREIKFSFEFLKLQILIFINF